MDGAVLDSRGRMNSPLRYKLVHGVCYRLVHGVRYRLVHGVRYRLVHGVRYRLVHGVRYSPQGKHKTKTGAALHRCGMIFLEPAAIPCPLTQARKFAMLPRTLPYPGKQHGHAARIPQSRSEPA